MTDRDKLKYGSARAEKEKDEGARTDVSTLGFFGVLCVHRFDLGV
jgi:hypothetical protein